jgi:hypothetical protein
MAPYWLRNGAVLASSGRCERGNVTDKLQTAECDFETGIRRGASCVHSCIIRANILIRGYRQPNHLVSSKPKKPGPNSPLSYATRKWVTMSQIAISAGEFDTVRAVTARRSCPRLQSFLGVARTQRVSAGVISHRFQGIHGRMDGHQSIEQNATKETKIVRQAQGGAQRGNRRPASRFTEPGLRKTETAHETLGAAPPQPKVGLNAKTQRRQGQRQSLHTAQLCSDLSVFAPLRFDRTGNLETGKCGPRNPRTTRKLELSRGACVSWEQCLVGCGQDARRGFF